MKIILVIILLLGPTLVAAEEGPGAFVYAEHNKRDPFWPLVTPSGAIATYEDDLAASDMILEGIIAGNERGDNLAIINGTIIKPGDKFGAYKISEITQNSVILIKGTERSVLQLKKED
ncbi:MAG: hypothetical protein WC552_08185 [Candidatus Omnitrophota bacterium]